MVLFYLRLYSNGNTNVGTVQKYLPPDGDEEALFHIVHDDDDSENLDGHECFAAMEQYRKNFSTFDSNSSRVILDSEGGVGDVVGSRLTSPDAKCTCTSVT